MPRALKPKVVYYWHSTRTGEPRVSWNLVGANGEVVCQSTQGFRDKADARRSIDTILGILDAWPLYSLTGRGLVREVGPGRKPAP